LENAEEKAHLNQYGVAVVLEGRINNFISSDSATTPKHQGGSRMKLKSWWVIGIVTMVAGFLLVVTRVTAAPDMAIELGTEAVALGATIDDLTVQGDVLVEDDVSVLVRGDSILRGERDVAIGATDSLYQWDGTDSATTLRTDGLGGWDATNGGLVTHVGIEFGAGRAANVTLSLYDTDGGKAKTTIAATAGWVRLPFSDMAGVDFTRIGAVELRVPNGVEVRTIRTESDVQATRSATLVEDANGDGRAGAGDLVAYAVTFTNRGENTTGKALWQTTIPGRNMVLNGAVTATGATAGSTRAGEGSVIRADISGLAADASATVRYHVRLQGGAVPISIVLDEGAVIAEGTVGTLNSPFTSGDGEVGFVGNLNTTDRFVWFDSGIIWQNSDAAPTNTLTGAEGTMGVGNNGEFIYSPTTDGGDSVWTHAGALLLDGQPAPNFPPPAVNTFSSRPHMMPNGTSLWVAGTDTSGGNTSLQRSLYSDADGAPGGIVTLLQTGTNYDGIPITAGTGIEFDYQQSDNLAHLLVTLDLNTGGTTDDAALGLNGTIRAREGVATGGGDAWSNFDTPSVNDSGNYVFAGDTNGATATDEFISYGTNATTPTIGIREGDTLDGILLPSGATVGALSLNNLNQAAFIWSFTGGETLFVACDATNLAGAQAILSINDEYDSDGGGSDGFINDFNASAAIGPGLWLAEDGIVYAEVDLAPPIPFAGGLREAVIGVETGCATGGTPTPTATADPGPTNTPTATPTNTTVPPTNTPTATVTATPGGSGGRVCSSTVVTIPDSNPTGVTSVINVGAAGTISDLNVVLTGTHSWVGDLRFNISNGTTNVTFYDQPGVPASTFGCSGDNLPGVVGDDEGSSGSFENSCLNSTPAYIPGGTYTGNSPLSAFDGGTAAGNWTLTVSDLAAGDTGTLDGWCVDITTGAGPTATPTASATPQGQVPDINANPSSFVETHSSPPQVTTDTLNIGNTGNATLNWTITEDDSRPFANPNPAQPRDPNAPVARLGAAGGSTTSKLELGPIVGDGSFETGTPNASWEEFSANFGTPLCDAVCGTGGGTGPRTGAWWAWFGGTTAAETGILTQTVTIPSGTAELSFWLEIPPTATGTNGFLSVRMDGTEVFRAEETTPGYGTYAEVTVDASAYADGGTHELVFFSVTDAGAAVTNFFVDDVAITATAGGQCTAPTAIPWLTVSPANGSTAGGGSTPVTLTYNSASLAQGTYTGTLCIASNDPDEALVTVPITLNVGPPTAIDLASFTSPVSGVNVGDIAAAGLLLLAGAVLLLRRK
jgi:subtilisin-like proprotein convertase family protein